ncbi:hypothetical protein NP493_1174g00015 [Ridgeia piscesae]|uniref:PPPDE domain-containing protein n=1 Tax=Ridgeia piscesae TaxID=27915 RepID=A0AAD9NH33_RIDPI|nr:hypothetical protein NP493_1174g00015 [Ridgeia piscesae]
MSFFRERFLSSCCKSRIFKPKVISVKVHLYDLSNGMATKLSPSLPGMGETQLTGIWHTGTVVFGQEFYYSNEGILKCTPARTLLGQPKRIIDMGSTDITEEEFLAHVEDLSNTSYRSADFHMILHNANKFTDELVFFLTGNNLPSYITFLPEEIPKRTKIFPVRLYIYDLSQGIIELLPQSIRGANLTGIWHTGVVVYRLEFFFSSAGIKICQPSGTILGDPHKTADLGETFVPFEKFMTYLQHLSTTSFR